MNNKEPSVSIIIPAYNARGVIKEGLDSVLKINYSRFKITVVDDNSQDDTAVFIKNNYTNIDVFKTRKNLGFAAAVNLGIKKTSGDIIVLLNMDTTVDTKWLRPLVNVLMSDKTIGLVGSKILYPDGKTIQHAGGILRANGLSVHIGKGELDNKQYDYIKDVNYLTGASLGFRRDILKIVGFFDEGYKPLYYEDADFSCRIRKKGYKVLYVPESMLIHKENISTGGLSDTFYYYYHKNRLRFVLKNYNVYSIITKSFREEKRWFFQELPPEIRRIVIKTYALNFFNMVWILIRFKLFSILNRERQIWL